MRDAGQAQILMRLLDSRLGELADATVAGDTVQAAENCIYHDPVDHSVSLNQSLWLTTVGVGRIVYRLSGTGTHGAILRSYLEQYAPDPLTISKLLQWCWHRFRAWRAHWHGSKATASQHQLPSPDKSETALDANLMQYGGGDFLDGRMRSVHVWHTCCPKNILRLSNFIAYLIR